MQNTVPELLPQRSACGRPRYKVDGYLVGLPALSFMPKGTHFGDAELLRPDGEKMLVAVNSVPEDCI